MARYTLRIIAFLSTFGLLVFFNRTNVIWSELRPRINEKWRTNTSANQQIFNVNTSILASKSVHTSKKQPIIITKRSVKSGPLTYKNRRVIFPPLLREPRPQDIVFHRVFTPHPKYDDKPQAIPAFTGVTLVTAYFNIGTFTKNFLNTIHNSDLYRSWMDKYSAVLNPLIIYADNQEDLDYFMNARRGLPTKCVLLRRKDLWAFSIQNETTRIFKQKGYPVYYPYSTRPDYISAVHAKYEVLLKALKWNPFNTSHFAWSDVGLYREVRSKVPYRLVLPYKFNHDKVNIGEVVGFPWQCMANRRDIFYRKLEWLAGGFFIAAKNVMARHAQAYIDDVKSCMKNNLNGADQQILYDLINTKNHLVDIQVYTVSSTNQWFAFMFFCRQEQGRKRR